MTFDEMKQLMEFLLEQQNSFDARIAYVERQNEKERREREELRQLIRQLAEQAEADREYLRESFLEMRVAVGRLVDFMENSREFTIQVAHLAIASEKRLARLEGEK